MLIDERKTAKLTMTTVNNLDSVSTDVSNVLSIVETTPPEPTSMAIQSSLIEPSELNISEGNFLVSIYGYLLYNMFS